MLPLAREVGEELLLRGVGLGPTYCSDGAEASGSGSVVASWTGRIRAGGPSGGSDVRVRVLANCLNSAVLPVRCLMSRLVEKVAARFLEATVDFAQMGTLSCLSARVVD